ncbi:MULTISPECIES: helix-turn-helix domain-containing protein [unclassified Aeromicrobium]|uniref:helix-turn-helix domain-containing protein n=1 Tax=unclassified Aeromicrobium TaxID=2633570 RepID=UPI00396B1466
MNVRRESREQLGLTQAEAASRAGISFATWRRWEEDPSSVKSGTAAACARILDRESALREELATYESEFAASWTDNPYLTPRQAYAIAGTLNFWGDMYLAEWLSDPTPEPLHQVTPFERIDLRAMMLVGENKAWVELAKARCFAVANELKDGILPFDRDGCYFDELLMALALPEAREMLTDEHESFTSLPPSTVSNDAESAWTDDDWDAVSDSFDDRCRWDEWEVPTMTNHPLLRAILDARHPFTWFDRATPTGPGYLNRLIGIETLAPADTRDDTADPQS